jgi:glycosyltransferase involved in cell wall biosynthesis
MKNTAPRDKIDALVECIEDFHLLPTNPMVSVCVTTYNHEKFIHQTLDGILMQHVQFPYEIVVAEDHSKDTTREIVVAYQKQHPDKIRLRLACENLYSLGYSPSGTARAQCRGKYIALCEGDDYWTDPLKLQKQVDFLEANPGYALCFHAVKIYQHNSGEFVDDYITPDVPETTDIYDLARRNFIHTPSVMHRKDNILKSCADDFFYKQSGDYFLHMVNAQYGKIKKIADIMAVYRVHDGGIWSQLKDTSTKSIQVYDAIISYFTDVDERVVDIFQKKREQQIRRMQKSIRG